MSFSYCTIIRFQLLVQVGVFASLFVIMFETYPFRVGLMGMLTSKYLAVYAINMVYILMTASVYGYRVVRNMLHIIYFVGHRQAPISRYIIISIIVCGHGTNDDMVITFFSTLLGINRAWFPILLLIIIMVRFNRENLFFPVPTCANAWKFDHARQV